MRRFFTILLFVSFALCVNAQQWVVFTNLEPSAPEFNVLSNNSQEVKFEIEIPGIFCTDTVVNGTTYSRLILPGGGAINPAGLPEIPVIETNLVTKFETNIENMPITGAIISIDNKELTTNEHGTAVISLIDRTYFYTVSKAGYIQFGSELTVAGESQTVPVIMDKESYEITFEINIEDIPNPGVFCVFELIFDTDVYVIGFQINQQQITLTSPLSYNGDYSYRVTIDCYEISEGKFTVDDEPQTIIINMHKKKYDVTFEIKDINNFPISDAKISIENTNINTNEQGTAVISLKNGIYSCTVSKTGYIEIDRELIVLCNTQTIFVEMLDDIGVKNVKLSDIMIYPNPATEELQVTNYELQVEKIEIFDVFGSNVVVTFAVAQIDGTNTIDISHLLSGVYFIRITTKNETIIKKIIKY